MKNGKLKSIEYFKMINGISISEGVLAVGGVVVALASAFYVNLVDYKNIDEFKSQISQTSEFNEYENDKVEEYYTAYNNGELEKKDLMERLDQIDNIDNFLQERGTEEQNEELESLVKIKDRNLIPACVGVACVGIGFLSAYLTIKIGEIKYRKMAFKEENDILTI